MKVVAGSAFFGETDFQFHVGLRALSGTRQTARKKYLDFKYFFKYIVINPVFQ